MRPSASPVAGTARLSAPLTARRAVALVALAVLVFLVLTVVVTRPPWSVGIQVSALPDYELYGEAVVAGEVPYRDVKIEYPPGSIPAFALPAVVADGKEDYTRAFAWLMRLCGVLMIVAVGVSLRALGRSCGEAALALAALMPLMLGRIVLQRFDLLPAALFAIALAALLSRRERLAFAALALGVGTKLYPIVALPIFLAAVGRRRGWRAALSCLLVFAGVLAAMIVPFAISGPDGLAEAFTRQAGRPLHHESTGGAALLAVHQLTGLELETAQSHGSTNLPGEPGDTVASLSVLLQIGALAAIWLLCARRPLSDELVVRASAAAVVAFVVLGKVLSPQFLIWLVPLVPLIRGRSGAAASAALAVAVLLTQSYFPRRYLALEELAALPSWLLIARDAALVALLAVLTIGLRSDAPSRLRPR